METSIQPPDPSGSENTGIMGEIRHLLAAISIHLLALIKLGQMEIDEAKRRMVKKVVFLVIAALFFFASFMAANAAGAFYLYEYFDKWETALLALALGNLAIGILFVIIAGCLSLTPVFKDTMAELETDLLWISEKYRAKTNSNKN